MVYQVQEKNTFPNLLLQVIIPVMSLFYIKGTVGIYFSCESKLGVTAMLSPIIRRVLVLRVKMRGWREMGWQVQEWNKHCGGRGEGTGTQLTHLKLGLLECTAKQGPGQTGKGRGQRGQEVEYSLQTTVLRNIC